MKIGRLEIRVLWNGGAPLFWQRDVKRWLNEIPEWEYGDLSFAQKINAIKKLRAKYDISLREAKEVVEAIMERS